MASRSHPCWDVQERSHKASISDEGGAKLSPAFADRLRAARKLNHATQADLARAAQMHVTAIAHMEAGRREPSLAALRRLTEALGVRADFLLGLTPPRLPAGRPNAQWLLEFARRWSSSKDDDAVKALAWNVNGAFSEWADQSADNVGDAAGTPAKPLGAPKTSKSRGLGLP